MVAPQSRKPASRAADEGSPAEPDRRDVAAVYRILSERYPTFDQVDDPWMANGLSSTPFRSLVSTCLSTMTVTKRVVAACVPLYERVGSFEALLALDDDDLRAIIKPVAHYNRKTRGLKIMARQVVEEHGGQIPCSRDELMALHGVGRKVADIMMNVVFEEPSIAVDTHVLRVLNRLGIVDTRSAETAADLIDAATPPRYKRHAHEWLVQHGMTVCASRRPRCEECPLTERCDWFAAHRVA